MVSEDGTPSRVLISKIYQQASSDAQMNGVEVRRSYMIHKYTEGKHGVIYHDPRFANSNTATIATTLTAGDVEIERSNGEILRLVKGGTYNQYLMPGNSHSKVEVLRDGVVYRTYTFSDTAKSVVESVVVEVDTPTSRGSVTKLPLSF
jgi:hypothetical protein